jgi:hypothetical protein
MRMYARGIATVWTGHSDRLQVDVKEVAEGQKFFRRKKTLVFRRNTQVA